jgi:hypothetical protein
MDILSSFILTGRKRNHSRRFLRSVKTSATKFSLLREASYLALSIYLPIGSEPGKYEVEMGREAGKPLAKAEGSAMLRGHIAVLEVKLNLEPLRAGVYRLGIRQRGWSWTYYRVVLR